jgi:hypothetical protein
MSPFLYIILEEGLGCNLSRAKIQVEIKGITILHGVEALFHLQLWMTIF